MTQNREIKFRAWDVDNKEMSHIQDDEIYVDGNGDLIHPARYILMQYTGVRDKNGKEIYEGDILQHKMHYPVDFQDRNPHLRYDYIGTGVEWEDGFWFIDRRNPKNETLLTRSRASEWEVIGNIYENPDLLIKDLNN